MHRKRSLGLVLGIACLSVMALSFSAAAGAASDQASAHSAAKVTVINVTAGKPAELGFKLSKFSALPAGTITFKVTNMGFAFHDFKICTKSVSSAAKNSCVGKVTAILKPGKTATLTVVLTKNGKYEYLCTVPGHAASGMKGLIGIGVKVTPTPTPTPATTMTTTTTPEPEATTTPAATTTTTPAGGGGGGATECASGTIQSNGHSDQDSDETGALSDGDGCI
jgi:uncharacterized cupredoxin-like copper-binding protein